MNNYLACEYLTTLKLKVVAGELSRPKDRPGQSQLLSKLGDEHEEDYLRRLLNAGRQVTTIEHGCGVVGIKLAAAATEAAMERRDEVIYQAAFFKGVSLAYSDFVVKISEPLTGSRWSWHLQGRGHEAGAAH